MRKTPSYNQKVKRKARREALSHAVDLVTCLATIKFVIRFQKLCNWQLDLRAVVIARFARFTLHVVE